MPWFRTAQRAFISSSLAASLGLMSAVAGGAPAVQQVSGSVSHDSSVTIRGLSFGTKPTAPPVIWDDGTGSSLSSKWSLAAPSTASVSSYNTQYRSTGYRGVAGPHVNSTKYIVGGHTNTWSPSAGGAVMVSKDLGALPQGSIYYARAYYRLDPSWQFAVATDDNNHKWWVTNFGGSGPYETEYFYVDYDQGKFKNSTTAVQHKISPNPLMNPDVNGHSNWWSSSLNPVSGWSLYEVESRRSTSNNGYLKVWADGVLVVNYAGPTDAASGSSISVGFGGYSSTYVISPVSNFRYFADVYVDNTAARVVLANNANLANATVIEPQIPSRWTSAEIDVRVNAGKLGAGQTAYLFVVDSAGSRNASGFPVVVGNESQNAVPKAPSGVVVN